MFYHCPSARMLMPSLWQRFCRWSSYFFTENVKQIRSTTSGSAPPTFRPSPHGATFIEFAPLIGRPRCCHCTAIRQVIRHESSSSFDAKGCFRCTHAILTHLFNRSLSTSCVPAYFKDSFVTPILKKSGLDEASPSSYRPISNLSVICQVAGTSSRASVCNVPWG